MKLKNSAATQKVALIATGLAVAASLVVVNGTFAANTSYRNPVGCKSNVGGHSLPVGWNSKPCTSIKIVSLSPRVFDRGGGTTVRVVGSNLDKINWITVGRAQVTSYTVSKDGRKLSFVAPSILQAFPAVQAINDTSVRGGHKGPVPVTVTLRNLSSLGIVEFNFEAKYQKLKFAPR